MSNLALDTFIRSNQSGWGTATDGQSWAVLTGPATAAIASNEGTLTGSVTQTIQTLGSNTSVDAELCVRLANTQNTDSMQTFLRLQSATTHYRCRLLSQALTIHKVVSGTATQLVTSAFTTTAGSFYFVRFRVVGTTLLARVWASGSAEPTTWLLNTTDSAISGAGQFGLGATLNASGNTASFDSFLVTDLAEKNTVVEILSTSGAEADTDSATGTEILTSVGSQSLDDAASNSEQITMQGVASQTDTSTITESSSMLGVASPIDSMSLVELLQLLGMTTTLDPATYTDSATGASSIPRQPTYAEVTLVARDGRTTLVARDGRTTLKGR